MSLYRTISEIFCVKNGVPLKTRVGRSRSLKMAPFYRSYTTFYWSAIVPFSSYLTLNNRDSIVTNYSHIFNRLWNIQCQNWVRGCSRSLKMAPFDRSHMGSYSLSTVTIALSFIIWET